MLEQKKLRNFIGLVLLLVATVLVSLHVGTLSVPIGGVIQTILDQCHIPVVVSQPLTDEQSAVLWYIRLPRVIIGAIVGASLAMAGAIMQGVFSNPLADPSIMGVSAGASLGAVIAIALGLSSLGLFYLPAFAFLGAALAVCITVGLTLRDKKVDTVSLLLAGVTVSMLLGAFTSGVLTLMNEYRLREFIFWVIGGLDFRRWDHVWIAIGPFLVGGTLACLLGRQLNVLALGETEARALGVPTMVYRLVFLLLASFITAVAVCVSGAIGFVGLVIPHIIRLLLGPDHRVLLPFSAIGGAIFLLCCDTLGRTIASPTEIRVGIMTSLLGAPYFLYLLQRVRKRGGL